MKITILLLLLAITSFLLAQEVPNAINYVGTQTNSYRADGKYESEKVSNFKSEQVLNIEKKILELRKSGVANQTEIVDLQKQIDALTKQSVTLLGGYYPGKITQPSISEQLVEGGNNAIFVKNNVKCIATAIEYTGTTAGRIWTVAGFEGAGSSATPDSLRVLYSSNNGMSWYLYANITLGGTDKINYGDIDIELIEGGTNKYLYILYGLRASGGTGKWFAAGSVIQLTGTFGGSTWVFNWPGDDASKRYYSPKITSDNAVWITAPWVYIAVSFDSAGTSGRVNTQKFAQLNSPNTINPVFNYKANKIYWVSETAVTQNLYTDIAFFQRGFIDSLVISFCGVPDSTKVFFSKMSASGGMVSPSNPGQYIGPIGGSEPNYMKYGGRLSSNGNSNGSIFFIFNQKSATTDGVKYFRTTNYGNFNDINQSIIWSAPNGVSKPDIMGVRNAYTHRIGFFFLGSTADSLKYISVGADGNFITNSSRMNSANYVTTLFAPSIGMRFSASDSCFAVYSGNGPSNVWSAYGCSGTVTGIIQNEIPVDYKLNQNYPNPFNPVTKINYSLPKSGFVTLRVYDILGREVALLVNEMKNGGNYSIDFDGFNLTSGIYFCKLEVNGFTDIKRMMLIK